VAWGRRIEGAVCQGLSVRDRAGQFMWLLALLCACYSDVDPPTTPTGGTMDTESGSPSTDGDYHPDGFDVPEVHGLAAKHQDEDCTACHGADLRGGEGAPSCDDCHTEGWAQDCTFCHGGTEDATGAPPQDIDDGGDPETLSFSPHPVHVQDSPLKVALACSACHLTPTHALDPGHFLVADATAAVAEVDFSGGVSAQASWDAGEQSCSSVWCHGDGQGHNGAVKVGDTVSCGDCHAGPDSDRDAMKTMSGKHAHHLNLGYSCRNCHESVADDEGTILDLVEHVNGVALLDIPEAAEMAVDDSGSTLRCTGSCHGERHEDRPWGKGDE